jgi:hypothetical protein
VSQDRWKNRRAMAWASLCAGLAYPLLVLFTESDQLGAIAAAFYVFVSAVVGAYIGFATWDDKDRHPSRLERWEGLGEMVPPSTAHPEGSFTCGER